MTQPPNKTYFVRRRDKVFGPFTAKQILSGKAANKYQDSDLISESAQGPWIDVAHHLAATHAAAAPEAAPPPVVANGNAPGKAQAAPDEPAKPAPKQPSSTWKYVALAIAAVFAVGIVGLGGLVILVMFFALTFSAEKSKAQVAAVEPQARSSNATESTTDSAMPESGDESSTDDVTKILGDLHEQLAEMNKKSSERGAESDADAQAAQEVAIEDYSELSDELKALSAKEATQAAMKMLSPSQREAEGRTALLLLSKAASEGDGGAMYYLSLCYLKGWGAEVDEAKGLAWLKKSAETADLNGMFAFSTAIRQGWYEGLGQAEGSAWRERAANAGHQGAINEIKREQVNGAVAGVLGALAEMPDPKEGEGESKYACLALPGPLWDERDRCKCPGFRPGGGPEVRDSITCVECSHSKSSHVR